MSMWALISWFTPTSLFLFLFLNLMIGTIVLTSRFGTHKKPEEQHQEEKLGLYNSYPPLVRSSSLLDRVRSINFSDYKFLQPNPEPLEAEHVAPPHADLDIPTGLTRTPSLLERVRSINFSHYYQFQQPNLEPLETELVASHHANSHIPTGLTRTPSLLDRLKSMDFSFYKSEQPDRPESESLDPSGFQHEAASDTSPRRENLVHRSKSDRGSTGAPVQEHEKMKKSASERFPLGGGGEGCDAVEDRRPKTARVEKTTSFGGDEEVDAKADDFINRFKQQLRLQRLDSLLRYKEMLKKN